MCSARFGLVAKTHEQQGVQTFIGALGQSRQTRALRLQGVDVLLPNADVQTFFLQPAQTAQHQLPTIHLGQHTLAGHGLQVLRGGACQALLFCGTDHRTRQGVFTAALHACSQSQSRWCILAGRRHMGQQSRSPHGECAGFVKGHGLHTVRQLQCLHVFDQDAVFGRHARARHDGHRRGQAQGTRAGDDQHGHCVDEGGLKVGTGHHPRTQGEQGDHQHHRHKHFGHFVHQPLNGRFGRLGVFDQADDV